MSDIVIFSPLLYKSKGDPGYDVLYDFNRNGYINDADLAVMKNHFNTISSNYPTNFVVSTASLKEQY